MAKSDNLLAILWLLRSRHRMTAGDIAREIEVDVRTVYRYIDALSASGAPIVAESGPNGGYEILDSFRETPLFFSRAERVALAHASLFAQKAGYPYSADLSEALQKMERLMSPEQIEQLNEHVAGLVVIDTAESADPLPYGETSEAARASGDPRELLKSIESAVADAVTITFRHAKDGWHELMNRTVDPYGLIYWRENWYLVGYCHLRTDIRMFRCDRMFDVLRTDREFVRPAGFSAREYFLAAMVPASYRSESPEVELTGEPWAVEHVSHHWYVRHFILEREHRRLGLGLRADRSLELLPEIIVAYGSALHVLRPKPLADEVVAFARSVVDAYRSDGPTN